MLSAISRWWGGRRARPQAKCFRKARLLVEALEERAVPTIAFTPAFGAETTSGSTSYSLQSPAVNLVFSGSYWTTTQGQQDEAGLVSAAQSIMSGPYLSGLTQYGSDGKALFGRSWNDAALTATNPSTAALQGFLQNSITRHNAAPGTHDWQHAPIFVVISDPTSSAGSNSGWNGPGNYVQTLVRIVDGERVEFPINENIRMVWLSTSAGGDTHVWKDGFTDLFSHELAESMAPAVVVTTPTGLPASVKGDQQIADNEPDGGRYMYRLGGPGGNLVQAYWSSNDGAFIVPDGKPQTFFLDPNWTGSSFNRNFNLRVQGDQLGTNYGDIIRVDAQGLNSSVTLNNQNATFDAGQLKAISIDTRGGYNNVRIAGVASGVAVNVDSSGTSNDFVVVGSDGGSLAGIQGPVNVANNSGHTWLEIYDPADGPRHITATDHSVAFNGLTTITYEGGFQWNGTGPVDGVTTLEVDDGLGPNQIEVDSVPPLTNVMVLGSSTDVLFGPAAGLAHLYRTH
jgi:hypothetical protein